MPEQLPHPRQLGRPPDPAKVEAVLDASWRLFLARGVEAVTVDLIAAEAGVSKGTVYAHFPDKRALFQEGVRRESVKIEASQALDAKPDGATLAQVLTAFGIGIMTFLTSAGPVDFYAQLSGELRRDPELAQLFYDAGPGRTRANLAAILGGPLAADLAIDDPESAAEMLFGMWQGMTHFQLMLNIDHRGVVTSIAARVAEGVDRFMSAYAKTVLPE